MFFYLSKILSFLITPVFWIFTLFVFALFLRNPKRKKRCLVWGIILFYFFSNSFILEEVNRLWEIPAVSYEDLEEYDAGIVLGGLLMYDERLDRIQFTAGADRLFQALELYKTGAIKKIIFTGGSGSIEFLHLKEGMFVRRYLLVLGIPERDIWVENESRNTWENALFTAELLKKNYFLDGKFLLITSGSHMRRSLACFRKAGITADPYSVDRRAGVMRRYAPDHLFFPNSETLWKWESLFHEWIGLVVYKVKGYA